MKNNQFIFPTLISIYTTALILRGFLATKIVSVAGIVFPAGLVAFPLSFICNDIFSEVYGYKKTKGIIIAGLLAQLLSFALINIAILLPGAEFWHNEVAFNTILSQSLRITFASLIGYYFGELTNSFVLSRLKIKQNSKKGLPQAKRFVVSTIWGELVDSLLFVTLAFYGTYQFENVVKLILTTWILKTSYEIIFLPISIPIANYIKTLEEGNLESDFKVVTNTGDSL